MIRLGDDSGCGYSILILHVCLDIYIYIYTHDLLRIGRGSLYLYIIDIRHPVEITLIYLSTGE